MTNGIQFRMVVKSTCLNNMYHYRYQERTPNTLLPIKATSTSIMHNNDQVTGELLNLQDYKSLTLR